MPKTLIMRFTALLFVLVMVGGVLLYMRPLGALQPISLQPDVTTYKPVGLPWPAYGQAAIGASSYGLLESHGTQTAVPIASITKVVTALAVLDKHPVVVGQQGEVITLSDNDVSIYNDYVAKDGSVAKVVAGEQISEYQALQALLLPSANNVADSLAIWAFGSMDSYVTYANQMLVKMGLSQSHVTDASGFSPQSVSSASELVTIGEAALSNDVMSEIVSQPEASIPVAGVIQNVNWLLGSNGVVGIKTGNTTEAGGCYLFAADVAVGSQKVKMVGAVLGAPALNTAISDSQTLIKVADTNFEVADLAKSGTAVGTYRTPWGANVSAITTKDISLLVWKGQQPKLTTSLDATTAYSSADKVVGSVSVTVGKKTASSPVVLQKSIPKPSLMWRIFR